MKITRRTVLRLTGAAAASLALSSCSASGSAILGSNFSSWLQQTLGISSSGAASSAASSEAMAASSLAAGEQPAASLAALPAYDADPLTGEAKRSNGRIVGVMVNNISNTSRQNARKGPQFLIRHKHRRQIPYYHLLGFAPDRCAVPEACLLPLGLQGVQQAVRQSRKPGLPRFPHRRQIVRQYSRNVDSYPRRVKPSSHLPLSVSAASSRSVIGDPPRRRCPQEAPLPPDHRSRWRDRPCGRRRTDTPSIPGAAARSPRR